MASADFSQFVVTTANGAVCETSRDKPASLSSSTCLIYAYGLRLPFGLCCFSPAYPPQTPYYQVSVRQATISLSLLLAYSSRSKPWESLWGSSATTPLVDFHHRLTACPSYIEEPPFGGSSLESYYSVTIAPTGHPPSQAPQSMQVAASTSNLPSPSEIAFTGH